MNLSEYVSKLSERYQTNISREHSYRGDLEALIKSISPEIFITNEPAKVTDCGNPDYVITNKASIAVGYIEAKDIGKDLNGKEYKEQFKRYRNALDNLIITDYCWFQFFRHGELVHEIRIAEIDGNKVKPLPENFAKFTNLIRDFCDFITQTIKSPQVLAEMMAGKARLLENILENAVLSDEESAENTSLKAQYETFKKILIHDLEPKGFADIYAQTLAYGMFAARLHDETINTFSRQEAAELIPKTNPFLRKLFNYIAGIDIDERIKPTVDNLADVFRATDIRELLQNFGKATQSHDPIIHFYETFLAKYDPDLRKKRGVWYTPEPVVSFIVRAVDEVLKTDFGLKDGIADTSKTKIEVTTQQLNRNKTKYQTIEKEVHKVQILDPATGTGTFLAEVVKYIYSSRFKAMQGVWNSYVDNDLIPRLNGFEILMASYAMAHLKLDMLLKETGYKSKSQQRFNIFLTNSLEEYHPDTGTLFADWLSTESKEANRVKRDTPVMVVLGNPPYSGESQNKGEWIMRLMDDYKKEPGGKDKLNERNSKVVNDDYVKFMRYAQYYIEKNGEGILAFINPHGFLDNPTFRGMRWHLLKTYDKLYTIDLHGNSKKKETTPDGGKDENVFDIQQGVSINVFVKTGTKKSNQLGQVYHYDCYGKREDKYQFLLSNNLSNIPFVGLSNNKNMYYMTPKDYDGIKCYESGFGLDKFFIVSASGVKTHRDNFVIDDNFDDLMDRIKGFFSLSKSELKSKYSLKESGSWKVDSVKSQAKAFDSGDMRKIMYRPFDSKYIYYNDHFIDRSRRSVMENFSLHNTGIVIARQSTEGYWSGVQIVNEMIDNRFHFSYKGIPQESPLYIYPDASENYSVDSKDRIPNLHPEIVKQIANNLSLIFTPEKEDKKDTFAPIDLLDYIYAVLHSPNYREKYKEFLKIDFPRVPYPKDANTFWQLVELGGQIRELHLLESPSIEQFITSYPESGDNVVTRKMTKSSIGFELTNDTEQLGKVWINDNQYFDNVPLVAWEFYIGGYQPAQKWLKDRVGRELSFDNILHYQKIIVALTETDRLMKAIDAVGVEW